MGIGFDDVAAFGQQHGRVRPLEVVVDGDMMADDLDPVGYSAALDAGHEPVLQEAAPEQQKLEMRQPGGGVQQCVDAFLVELAFDPRRRCHEQGHLAADGQIALREAGGWNCRRHNCDV